MSEFSLKILNTILTHSFTKFLLWNVALPSTCHACNPHVLGISTWSIWFPLEGTLAQLNNNSIWFILFLPIFITRWLNSPSGVPTNWFHFTSQIFPITCHWTVVFFREKNLSRAEYNLFVTKSINRTNPFLPPLNPFCRYSVVSLTDWANNDTTWR